MVHVTRVFVFTNKCPAIIWLFVTFNAIDNWQTSVHTCSGQCSGLWWTELISWSCKISYSSKYQALHKTVQNNLFNSIKMLSWKIYHIQCIFKKIDIALYTSYLTHLKAGAQKKIVWGPENKYNRQLIQNQKCHMISETTLITVVATSFSPTPQIYTCQLSHLRRESHACELKTSFSRQLTLTDQIVTPGWKMWAITAWIETLNPKRCKLTPIQEVLKLNFWHILLTYSIDKNWYQKTVW